MTKNYFPAKFAVLTAVLCVLVAAQAARAGTLRGKVTVSGALAIQKAHIDAYPGIAGRDANDDDVPPIDPNPNDVVLIVEAQGTPKPGHYTLAQSGLEFSPRVLGIPVGSTVDFPNEDLVFHNVFSYSKTKKFDLGYYGKGKSKSVTFNKPGLVKVFCDIHSHMSAYIYVSEYPFIIQPDTKGNYAIDGLPAGDYTLRVWHPDAPSRDYMVTIGDDTTTLDIRL